MNSILTRLALLLFVTLFMYRANAQVTLLTEIFSQMNDATNQFFNNNLDSLNHVWNPDLDQTDDLFSQLGNNLLDSIPPGNFDVNSLTELGAGLDTFSNHLGGLNLPGIDKDTLLGELGWIGNILGNNFDSLNGVFGQYHDSLIFKPEWDVTVLGFDTLNNHSYGILENELNNDLDMSNPNGPGNFASLLDKIFDVNLFPDIELAFGSQDVKCSYWGKEYNKNAKVFRIGSVPRFDKKVFDNNGKLPVVPIEARWHVEVSWFSGDDNTTGGDSNNNTTEGGAFNPMLFFGDYALMATPQIGVLGNTTFRLITSLGTEFGTYAPAHKDFDRRYTSSNKGYTTGVGAQAGAGVAFTTGALTVYSLATYAQGQTLKAAQTYPYSDARYEVGARYGKIINVRYSSGITSWQTDGNRVADVKNQFTVGLILAELHH